MKSILGWIGVGTTIVGALLVADWIKSSAPPLTFGGTRGITSQACDVSTSTEVVIGPTTSNGSAVILSAYSGRAWARISMPPNATTTNSFSFDEGANAVAGDGIVLTASTTRFIDFGLNTDFPYTGEVRGITDNTAGTSTVTVTECRF